MTEPTEEESVGHLLPYSFSWIPLKEGSRYIYHSKFLFLQHRNTDSEVTLLVTNNQLYCILENATHDLSSILWVKSLKEIHSVLPIGMAGQDLRFSLVFQNPVTKSKLRSTKLEEFLEEIEFSASSSEIRDDWIVVMKEVLNRVWQPQFELLYMQSPEVYQFHIMANKVNDKGRFQIRCLAFSKERFYLFHVPESHPLNPGKIKWSSKITNIKKIAHTPDNPDGFTLVDEIKGPRIWHFQSNLEKEAVLKEIKRLYTVCSGGKSLEEEGGGLRSSKPSKFFRTLYN